MSTHPRETFGLTTESACVADLEMHVPPYSERQSIERLPPYTESRRKDSTSWCQILFLGATSWAYLWHILLFPMLYPSGPYFEC